MQQANKSVPPVGEWQETDSSPLVVDQDTELEYDAYLDDEPQRKPKGKSLRKFRKPLERA
jgi:hypothetical protein